MFGGLVGKIAGGLAGGLLDKIGLGKLTPFVSLAANALTGNWLGVAKDVASMVSRFSGNNFLDRVAKQSPLGAFGNSGASGGFSLGNLLKGSRLGQLFDGLSGLTKGFQSIRSGDWATGARKIFEAFSTVKDFLNDQQTLNNRMSYSQTNSFLS